MRSGPATTSLIDALSATENANRRESVTRWRRCPITPPCATTITRLVGMRGDDALEPAPHACVELVERLGAGDHVPTLLAEDLLEHRILGDRALRGRCPPSHSPRNTSRRSGSSIGVMPSRAASGAAVSCVRRSVVT